MRHALRTVGGYVGRSKWLALLCMLLMLIDLMFETFAPLSVKFLIDYAIIPKDIDFLYRLLIILAVGAAASFAAGIIGDYMLSKLSARLHYDLRVRLFEHLQKLPIGYYQRVRSGDILTRFNTDLGDITETVYGSFPAAFRSAAGLFASLGIMFYLDWRATLCFLLGAAVFFIAPALLGNKTERAFSLYKESLDKSASFIQENVKGQTVIKGYNLEHRMIERFKTQAAELRTLNFRSNFLGLSMMRVPLICVVLLTLLILGVGSYLTFHDYITVGTFMAFTTTFLAVTGNMFQVAVIVPDLIAASASIKRINDILEETPFPNEPVPEGDSEDRREPPKPIRFEDVTFRYSGDKPALKNVRFEIPPGTFAALIGPSGSGKSSVIQLLLRFYDPQEGRVLFDGRDIRSIHPKTLRDSMAGVFQDNFLFHGTVRDNIAVSNPLATEEEIIAAAKQAEIHDFIMSLPDKYETLITDEGKNLSGGQRQRIAIARALLRNPGILILDEATSALDPITEDAINRTIARLAQNRTVISATHRLSSIAGADAIFVFQNGELIEQGNHEQLLAAKGFYREMWEKQSGITMMISDDGLNAEINEERIRMLPLFRNISMEAIREIQPFFVTEIYSEGRTVIREGEYGDKFYIIVRGKVEVSKKAENDSEQRVAVLQDGDHFGEIALLRNVPRTATVTTLTPTVFLSLQRPLLELVMHKHPDVRQILLETVQERM